MDRTIAPAAFELENISLLPAQEHLLSNGMKLNYINAGTEDLIRIEFIFDDPANGLGYVDGDYVKGNGEIIHTYDLLTDVYGFGGSRAFQDILDSIPNQLWCKKDFYGLDAAQEKVAALG